MNLFKERQSQFYSTDDADLETELRYGHPQISEGDEFIIQLIRTNCQHASRRLRVFDVGCGSGFLAARLSTELVDMIELIVHEVEPALVTQLRKRLEGKRVEIFSDPFETWHRPVDILLGWGSHHHLHKSYLKHAQKILSSGGIFILGDEFCPEYCIDHHAQRIRNANIFYQVNGFLLTTLEEVENYKRSKTIPLAAIELEQLRQQALWTWYRYVIDFAMSKNSIKVAVAELRAAHDDLWTTYSNEHKISPFIFEKEIELNGFQVELKQSFGPEEHSEYQSFFVYQLTTGGRV